MKNLTKSVVVLVALGLILLLSDCLLATEKDTTKTTEAVDREIYISEVILSAPWAEKNLVYDGDESLPGEFGVHQRVVPDSLKDQLDAGIPEGPTSFTVAPNGDIYITDPLNYRIQRFNGEGRFLSVIPEIGGKVWKWRMICVNKDNNVYLLWDELGKLSVRKYNQSGTFLRAYPVLGEEGLGGAGLHIRCNNQGDLFIEFTYSGEKAHPAVFKIVASGYALSEAEQKSTLRRGIVISNASSNSYEISSQRGLLIRYDTKGRVDTMLSIEILGALLGIDENENIFSYSMPQDERNRNFFHPTVNKYNKNGNLLASICWELRRGSRWGPFVSENKLVHKNGNIYLYWSTKEGITITKWSKQ